MVSVRRAVIDVGTNSVKLLVADVTGATVVPVHESSRQTRLGKGFYETHQLQPKPIADTAKAVREFVEIARQHSAKSIRVIATSAARDAQNPRDLTDAIESAASLKTEIISGAREADWAFQGVTTDPELAKQPLLLLDVGGGSTEFILGHGQKKSFAHSFPLGTVRLMEKFPHGDPPTAEEFSRCRDWVKEFLTTEVRLLLEPALRHEKKSGVAQLVGTGGTTSILGRVELGIDHYDRDRIENTVLTLARVRELRQHLWQLPLTQRQTVPGLPPSRADVILTGVLIYEALMEDFGFAELRISTRGLRFAAVMNE